MAKRGESKRKRQGARRYKESTSDPMTVAESTGAPMRRRKSAVEPIKPQPATMMHIGSRIYHARLLREVRMRDVAAAAGCSESMISKIESNKATPSLRVLHRICDALNLPLGDLLSTPDNDDQVVTKAGARHVATIDTLRKGKGIRMERLVPYARGHLLQGNIHVIAPGGSSDGDISHSGEEVGYVISGEIELTVDGKAYVVQPGDSFYYRSDLAHGYRNIGAAEARVLFVNTPPSF